MAYGNDEQHARHSAGARGKYPVAVSCFDISESQY